LQSKPLKPSIVNGRPNSVLMTVIGSRAVPARPPCRRLARAQAILPLLSANAIDAARALAPGQPLQAPSRRQGLARGPGAAIPEVCVLQIRSDYLSPAGTTSCALPASWGSSPVPIADQLVDGLRSAETAGAIPGTTPAGDVFRLGQLVEIREGPFALWRGTIERIGHSTIEGLDVPTRLTIAIEIFGQFTLTHLDLRDTIAPVAV